MRRGDRSRRWLFAPPLALACAVVSCSNVWGIPDREAAKNVAGCDVSGCTCAAGFGDCNAAPADGCETRLADDPHHCGACGDDCQHGTCVAGACVCDPATGFVDCDGARTNGCESDLATDAKHCGDCGRDCQAGSCSKGQCESFLAAASKDYRFAVVGDQVYFATDRSVRRAPASGAAPMGAPPDVATVPAPKLVASVTSNGDRLAWVVHPGFDGWAGTVIHTSRLDGSDVVTLATNATMDYCAFLAMDATHLYWTDDPLGLPIVLKRRILDGSSPEEILGQDDGGICDNLVAGPDYVLWVNQTGITRFGADGKPVVLFSQHVDAATAREQTVYFTISGALFALPVAGGKPALLASFAPDLGARYLGVSADTVYLIGATKILAQPLGGGAPRFYASGTAPDWGYADATSVYWSNALGVERVIDHPVP